MNHNESTALTYENLKNAYDALSNRVERDEYAPYLFSPVWVIHRRKGLLQYKPVRVFIYRILTWAWRKKFYRSRYTAIEIEQMRAWGK